MRHPWSAAAIVACTLVVTSSSEGKDAEMANTHADSSPAAPGLQWVAKQRFYFGHQSVGQNLIDGVRELLRQDSTISLTVVLSDRPDLISGPALIHSPVGVNGDPASKRQAFRDILASGFGRQGGVAFFKFCYADFSAATDVQAMFDEYRRVVDEVRAQYPKLTVVHVTAPLITVEDGLRSTVKRLIGRPTRRAVVAKINDYNDLLRSAYGDGLLFDLARWESTRPDGSRSLVVDRGDTVYTLLPQWTSDGGHLNAEGRQVMASRLVTFLTSLGDRARS